MCVCVREREREFVYMCVCMRVSIFDVHAISTIYHYSIAKSVSQSLLIITITVIQFYSHDYLLQYSNSITHFRPWYNGRRHLQETSARRGTTH